MNKKNFQYGDKVRVVRTGSDIDGTVVRVVGVSMRNVQDFYIVEFLEDEIRTMPPDFTGATMDYSAFTMTEACLERA